MYYVYVLSSSKDKSLYIGQTSDLQRRIKEHNQGKTRSLKSKIPVKLIYYEAYRSKKDSTLREWHLKHHGQQKEILKDQIENSIISIMPPSSSG